MSNAFTGDLLWLESMPKLQVAWLFDTQLSGPLPSMDKLILLSNLQLQNTQVSGGLDWIGSLPSLQVLYLYVTFLCSRFLRAPLRVPW